MKEIFISEIQNYLGNEVEITALLKDIYISENRMKNKWQEMIISDRSGEMIVRAWAELMNDDYNKLVGKVVKIIGQVQYYQNEPEIHVIAMDEVKNEHMDWSDYIQILSRVKAKEYAEKLSKYISKVKDPCIKALLNIIFDKSRIQKMSFSVGGTLHHNYFGGLLVHTVETCESAYNISLDRNKRSFYKERDINIDLVIAGALLHDVGKLNSYSGIPNGERTTRGQLISSSVESVLYATMYNSNLPKEQQVKDLSHLDHIILTAESMGEYGPYPRTIESLVVNEANRESVKLDGFETAIFDSLRRPGKHKKVVYSKINGTNILREV